MGSTKFRLVSAIAIALALASVGSLSLLFHSSVAQAQAARALTLTAAPTTVAEDVGTVTVTIGLNPVPTDGSWSECGLRVSADPAATATQDSDFTLETNDKTLDSGSSWGASTEISVTDDAESEVNEVFTVEAFCSNSSGGADPSHDLLTSGKLTITITDNDAPAAPSVDTATPGLGQIALAWNNPGDSTITKYQYRVSNDGGSNWSPDWTDIGSSGAGTVEFTVTGLSDLQEYVIELRAVAAGDEFGDATQVTATTPPPAITGSTAISFTENSIDDVATYTATEVAGYTIEWSLTGDDADDFIFDTMSGALKFNAAPDFENPSDNNVDREYLINVVATYTGTTTSQSTIAVAVTVSDVDEPPSPPSELMVSASGIDPHTQLALTWTAPENAGKPTITSYRVQYRVKESPVPPWSTLDPSPTETSATITGLMPSTTYEVQVFAINDEGESASSVSSEGSTVTQPTVSGPDAPSYAENGAGIVASYMAENFVGNDVTWSLGGADRALFTIGTGGALTFVDAPDFETPGAMGGGNVYRIVVTAATAATVQNASLAVSVTVTDLNEPPLISGLAAYSPVENGPTALGDYTAVDPENNAFTWTLSGADADDFTFDAAGALSLNVSPNYEMPGDSDGDNIYDVAVIATEDGAGGLSSQLEVTVTVQNVNELPGKPTGVSVTNSVDNPSNSLVVSWTDPDVGDKPPISRGVINYVPTQGGASQNVAFSAHLTSFEVDSLMPATTYTFKVSLGNSDGFGQESEAAQGSTLTANDPPTIYGRSAISFPENSRSTVENYDADESVAWSTTGADDEEFALSDQGVLTFRNTPDYEDPDDSNRDNVYRLTITATDQGDPARSTSINVRVTVTNKTLVLNDGDSTTEEIVREGNTFVGDFDFEPGEGDRISWRLLGDDAWLFEFSERSGNEIRIYFDDPPNFENPQDDDEDNVYEFTLRCIDNGNPRERAELDFEIAVANVVERTPPTSTPTKTPKKKKPPSTPTPRAINPPGKIPNIIVGANAEIYDVFTPVEGGNYQTSEYRIHAGPGSVPNGRLLGLRIYAVATDPSQIRHPNYTATGQIHNVDAVDREALPLPEGYRTNRPISICIPLPRTINSRFNAVVAMSTNTDGLTRVVRSRIVRDPDGIDKICGDVAELPTVMAAGIRTSSISPPPIADTPSPVPETVAPPATGGSAPSTGAWILLTLFGLLAVTIGFVTSRSKRQNRG